MSPKDPFFCDFGVSERFRGDREREIEVKLINTYKCMVCDKEFQTPEDLIYDRENNYLVICSKKCEFRFIYELIKKQGYSNENLKLLLRIIEKAQNINTFDRNLAIYELTKYYNKVGLPNVKPIGSRLKPKAQGSKNCSKAQGSRFVCVCNTHNEPELSLSFCNEPKQQMSLSFEKDLNKVQQKFEVMK